MYPTLYKHKLHDEIDFTDTNFHSFLLIFIIGTWDKYIYGDVITKRSGLLKISDFLAGILKIYMSQSATIYNEVNNFSNLRECLLMMFLSSDMFTYLVSKEVLTKHFDRIELFGQSGTVFQ